MSIKLTKNKRYQCDVVKLKGTKPPKIIDDGISIPIPVIETSKNDKEKK